MSTFQATFSTWLRGAAAIALLPLAGCVGFSPDGGMTPVVAVTSERLGKDIVKIGDDGEAADAFGRAAALLTKPLTVNRAVQIAFLRNRGLQASFHDLGVSEAEYVRASLPPEPQVSINGVAGQEDVEIVSQVAGDLLALATLPQRQAIAAEQFKAAQWRAASAIMALAAAVSRQFYTAVAAIEQVSFLEATLSTAKASAEFAKQLGEAGNLNKLDQAREDSFYTEVAAQLADGRLQAQAERERLTRLLGLFGPDISFKLPRALPPLPKRIGTEQDIEATALRDRLDLKVTRHELDALAGQLGLTVATRYVSDISLAVQNDTERASPSSPGTNLVRNGAVLNFAIPIYDFGQSRVTGAREAYLAAASRLAQKAIETRSQAREAYTRYRGKYDLAKYYQGRVLPLQSTILEQSSLQTNGMLSDVTQLLLDARTRIAANANAITARRDFFIAAVDLNATLMGAGPDVVSGDTSVVSTK